jgi:glutamine synthetase type III
LERDVLHQPQCDGRDSAVDSMDKEKSIIPSSEAEFTTGDHNNRCSPFRMGGNTFIYQTFQLSQPPSSNSNQ